MMCDVCHLFSAASSFIDSESFFTFFGFLPESWKKTNCHRLELQPLRRKSGANWLLQWHKDIFPESSCECFFPKQLLPNSFVYFHLHNISYFLYTTYIIYIIYIKFIYISYIIYIPAEGKPRERFDWLFPGESQSPVIYNIKCSSELFG